MSFKSKCTDSTAIMKMLNKSKIGSFHLRLLRLMRNEFKNILETQGFAMAISYAYQLGRISGISDERERRKTAEVKKMFSSLSPEVQQEILEVMRCMVESNEENRKDIESVTSGATI